MEKGFSVHVRRRKDFAVYKSRFTTAELLHSYPGQ